jgi:hypothetical protein
MRPAYDVINADARETTPKPTTRIAINIDPKCLRRRLDGMSARIYYLR